MASEVKYTSDQWEAVKKINGKKDYYDILGVQKDCSEEDLKRAYKRLALKLHPDKNSAPGATEAFKSVSKAFSALNDPQEKQRYDAGGRGDEEEDASSSSAPFFGSPFTYDGYHFYAEDLFSDDIFSMFFGQDGASPRHRQSAARGSNRRKSRPTSSQPEHDFPPRRQRQQYAHRDRQQHNQHHHHSGGGSGGGGPSFPNSYNFLVQMSPLLLMVLLSVVNTFFSYEDVYSLQQSTKYSSERFTSRLNVQFFLRDDFKEKYPGHLENIERQVEDGHIVGLRNKCNKEKSIKETLLWKAKMYNNRALYDQTKDRKLPSCEQLQLLVSSY